MDVYGRLAQLLATLSVPLPDQSRLIDPRPRHADLAARVGCSREMVSRLLKDLERGGFLSLASDGSMRLASKLPARW